MAKHRDSKTHEAPALTWQFPEYEKHTRSRRWFAVMLSLAALMLLFAMLTANYLFAVIILMVAIITYIHELRHPLELSCTIDADGVTIGSRHWAWKEFGRFWIIYEPPELKQVHLTLKTRWRPEIVIPLQDQDPLAVRKILLEYLEEDLEREGESTLDFFARLMKL